MERKIAWFISVVFHPIFVLFYAFLVVLYTENYFSLAFTSLGKLYFIIYIALLSVVFPLISLSMLKYFKFISSFEMKQRRERNLPIVMLGISYFIMFFFIQKLELNPIFTLIILAALMLCIVIFLINYFWKISIHTSIWGGFLGMLMAISINFNIDFFPIIIISILLAGFVGYARLKLKAHTPAQVYGGYIIGFLLLFLRFIYI